MISGYVGLYSKHRPRSIINLWICVLLYDIASAIALIIVHSLTDRPFPYTTVLFAFFPAFSGQHWYFSVYFVCFFFFPILNGCLQTLPRKTIENTLLSVCILLTILDFFFQNRYVAITYGYSIVWISFLYLLGGYFSKYQILKNISVKKGLVGYLACTILLTVCYYAVSFVAQPFWDTATIQRNFFVYNNLLVFCAIFLLATFEKLVFPQKICACIRYVAPTTFGVYIIHQSPAFRAAFLDGKTGWLSAFPFPFSVFAVCGTAVAIFAVCVVIERVCLKVFQILHMDRLTLFLEQASTHSLSFFKRVLSHVLCIKTIDPLAENQSSETIESEQAQPE